MGGAAANIVEEYVLLAALLHVFVALKRTWDISINYTIASGKLNLAMSGVLLLTFMTIHLFQFRLAETQMYVLCPPPYFINFAGIITLNLFWVWDDGCMTTAVRDIYKLEFDIPVVRLDALLHQRCHHLHHPHVPGLEEMHLGALDGYSSSLSEQGSPCRLGLPDRP